MINKSIIAGAAITLVTMAGLSENAYAYRTERVLSASTNCDLLPDFGGQTFSLSCTMQINYDPGFGPGPSLYRKKFTISAIPTDGSNELNNACTYAWNYEQYWSVKETLEGNMPSLLAAGGMFPTINYQTDPNQQIGLFGGHLGCRW